jgi:hypothetical protein
MQIPSAIADVGWRNKAVKFRCSADCRFRLARGGVAVLHFAEINFNVTIGKEVHDLAVSEND